MAWMEDRLQTSLKRYTTEDKMAAGAFVSLGIMGEAVPYPRLALKAA